MNEPAEAYRSSAAVGGAEVSDPDPAAGGVESPEDGAAAACIGPWSSG